MPENSSIGVNNFGDIFARAHLKNVFVGIALFLFFFNFVKMVMKIAVFPCEDSIDLVKNGVGMFGMFFTFEVYNAIAQLD